MEKEEFESGESLMHSEHALKTMHLIDRLRLETNDARKIVYIIEMLSRIFYEYPETVQEFISPESMSPTFRRDWESMLAKAGIEYIDLKGV